MQDRKILLWSFVFLVLSCNQKTFDTEKDMLGYLKDESNGYVQSKTVNGVDFTLMYRPTDLLVKQELGDEKAIKERVDGLRKKFNKYIYFNLSMSKNNQELLSAVPKNRNEFGAMVNDLVFGIGNKVHVFTEERDTLDIVDFVYPRMYGMSRNTTIMFVYPREGDKLKTKVLNFTIEDLGLYTGEVKFKIKIEKIINEPKLEF